MDIVGQGAAGHLHASDSPEYCTRKRLREAGKLGWPHVGLTAGSLVWNPMLRASLSCSKYSSTFSKPAVCVRERTLQWSHHYTWAQKLLGPMERLEEWDSASFNLVRRWIPDLPQVKMSFEHHITGIPGAHQTLWTWEGEQDMPGTFWDLSTYIFS